MKKLLLIVLGFFLLFSFVALPVFAQEKEKMVILSKGETIDRDYFAAGDETQISGTINGDAYVAGGTVIVDGTVNGDLMAAGEI